MDLTAGEIEALRYAYATTYNKLLRIKRTKPRSEQLKKFKEYSLKIVRQRLTDLRSVYDKLNLPLEYKPLP